MLKDVALLENWFRMTAVYLLLAGLLVFLVSGAMSRVEGSLAQTRAAFAEAVRERRARTEAEQALRENEERLRQAQEAAQIGTWEWDIPTGRSSGLGSPGRSWRSLPECRARRPGPGGPRRGGPAGPHPGDSRGRHRRKAAEEELRVSEERWRRRTARRC